MASASPRRARLRRRQLSACALLGVAALVWCRVSRTFAYFNAGTQRSQPTGGDGRRATLLGTALLHSLAAPAACLAEAPSVGGERALLNNGLAFPKASFGLQVYDDETGQRLTELAIAVGYRNFFASVLAGNQRGFARGVQKSGIAREELFICGSVVSNGAQGFENAYRATKNGCDENLEAFAVGGISYLDMIMLDYPAGDCDSIRGQWKAFEEMRAAGKTRSLAVSNFSPEQLDCIVSDPSATIPAVNQLPYSVKSYDSRAVEENRKRGILVQAWSPLGSGSLSYSASRACEEIGKAYSKSAAQVALRWVVQSGATFTTQSKSKEHFAEDLAIFDFQLTDSEMQRISAISSSLEGQLSSALDVALPVAVATAAGVASGQLLEGSKPPAPAAAAATASAGADAEREKGGESKEESAL